MYKLIILPIALCTMLFSNPKESDPSLRITHLVDSFYIYTTYNNYNGEKMPANGMYLITNNGVVLIDTPWDSTQFQSLLDSIQQRHQQKVTHCIATHWHEDRTAGLEYYKSIGIKTYSSQLTDELSKKNNKKRAEFHFQSDTLFNIGGVKFETYFPGEGHTQDNIVMWWPNQKVLYGGCLIKGASAKNLGYIDDGNILTYEQTLVNVQSKFQSPNYIIVSHHDWKDLASLSHSIKMARKLIRKK